MFRIGWYVQAQPYRMPILQQARRKTNGFPLAGVQRANHLLVRGWRRNFRIWARRPMFCHNFIVLAIGNFSLSQIFECLLNFRRAIAEVSLTCTATLKERFASTNRVNLNDLAAKVNIAAGVANGTVCVVNLYRRQPDLGLVRESGHGQDLTFLEPAYITRDDDGQFVFANWMQDGRNVRVLKVSADSFCCLRGHKKRCARLWLKAGDGIFLIHADAIALRGSVCVPPIG